MSILFKDAGNQTYMLVEHNSITGTSLIYSQKTKHCIVKDLTLSSTVNGDLKGIAREVLGMNMNFKKAMKLYNKEVKA